MDSICLPPPIVIAPIDDDVPANPPTANQHSVPSLNTEHLGMGGPYNERMQHAGQLLQQNPKPFSSGHGSSFLPHNFPGSSDRFMSKSMSHFASPTSAAVGSPANVSPAVFNPEPNNNCNNPLSPNNRVHFSPYGRWQKNFAAPFVQNQGGQSVDRPQIPAPVFPGYDGHSQRERNPMRLEQMNPYRNAAIPRFFPPPVFDQYNLPPRNAFSERPLFHLFSSLPHTQASEQGNTTAKKTSPPATVKRTLAPVQISFYAIDGKHIPCVHRGNERFTSVRVVEIKLLSKYPNSYPDEVKKRPPIKSTKMAQQEADAFNKLNKESTFEYGVELFDNDLLVKVSDFEDFYAIIKKHFPHTPSPPRETLNQEKERNSRNCSSHSGGWLQLNNTIVPYIERGATKYLPICIVKYAAGLPISNEPFNDFLDSRECKVLNEQCEKAGLTFSFHTLTAIGSLDMILKMSNVRLVINELPLNNPFDSATYDPSLEPNYTPPLQPGSQQNRKTSTVTSGTKSYPQMPPLIKMGTTKSKSPARSTCQTTDIMDELQKMTSRVAQSRQDDLKKQRSDASTGQQQSAAAVSGSAESPNKSGNTLVDLLKNDISNVPKRNSNHATIVESNRTITGKSANRKSTVTDTLTKQQDISVKNSELVLNDQTFPHYVFKAKDKKKAEQMNGQKKGGNESPKAELQKRPSQHPEAVQQETEVKRSKLEAKRVSREETCVDKVPNSRVSDEKEVHGKTVKSHPGKDLVQQKGASKQHVPQIVTEEVDGKSIACLKRPDGHIYALVEAVSRVYFFKKEISEIAHVIANVLGVETVVCTESEEQAFISFYGLPTSKLQIPTMCKVDTFRQYFPVLKYMFQDRQKDQIDIQKQVTPKVEKSSPNKKSPEKSVPVVKKQKQKKKKSKVSCLQGKKTLHVVLQDFRKHASLRKELCQLYQVRIIV